MGEHSVYATKERRFCMKLVADDRTIYLASEDESDFNTWFKALESKVMKFQNTSKLHLTKNPKIIIIILCFGI